MKNDCQRSRIKGFMIYNLTGWILEMEEEGFEPPRAVTPLAVFETAPFSQTWVFLRMKMEPIGFEPMTSCVRGRRSPS